MKKSLPIITGIISGIILFSLTVYFADSNLAFGADEEEETPLNFFDEMVAYGDFFSWNDVFNPNQKGYNLYMLMYDKRLEAPKKNALMETAKNFGYTREEIDAILGGSITPILNNPDYGSAGVISQEQAVALAGEIVEEFDILHEILSLEQEINTTIMPGELFANNDLEDSGFDLIHDLTVIEEILFMETEPTTIGGEFDKSLKSPFLPTEPSQEQEDFIALESGAAVLDAYAPLNIKPDEDFEESGKASITVGENEVEIEILEDDICPEEEGSEEEALNNFEKKKEEEKEKEIKEAGEILEGEAAPKGGFGQAEKDQQGGYKPDGTLEPAPKGQWGSTWCPGMAPSGASGSGSTFGSGDFHSLGAFNRLAILNPILNQSAGAYTSYSSDNLSAHIAVCFEVKAIKGTLSTFQPGSSCVICEVDKILESMDKTLSHSLIPNKVTGNLLESAKCKDAYTTAIDLNFIAIAAPVPTPPNDDIIFGKNIFDEWNKYVDRYQPFFLEEEIKFQDTAEFELASAPPDTTQLDLMTAINKDIALGKSMALNEIENFEEATDGTNISNYFQAIMAELKDTTALFKGYNEIFKDTVDACNAITNKPAC